MYRVPLFQVGEMKFASPDFQKMYCVPLFPWQMEKSYDAVGRSHFNKKTQQYVDTPHVHDPRAPGGVRVPNLEEIPK